MRFVLAVGCFWCVYCAWAESLIPAEVAAMLDAYSIPQEHMSIWVQGVDAHRPLVELNGSVPRMPASVTKLLTTSAGLIRLGADYRWQTRFYVENRPDAQGVLHGNLYIEGGADPFLVEEHLAAMIADLRARGLRDIDGNVVLDDSLYRLPAVARDRAAFDGHPLVAYNAVPNPLMVNFRTVQLSLMPQGKHLSVGLWPNMSRWQIDNRMALGYGRCRRGDAPVVSVLHSHPSETTLVLTGHYSTRCREQSWSFTMGEADEQFYALFHDLWQQQGGHISGHEVLGIRPFLARLFYTGWSVPLVEQIAKMNQFSNNVMTRQLMLTLGFMVYGRPGSLEKGRRAVLQTLAAFGVNTQGIVLDNGAGLSRLTRVKAEQLVMLLRGLYFSRYKEPFLASLAVAGESGTLKHRYRGDYLAGHLRGKTGTLDDVRAFAGYLRAKSGRDYVVVIIVNDKHATRSLALQGDLFHWVAQQ